MDLLPTPEQEEIITSVAAFLGAELPMARLRELHGQGAPLEAGVWRQCAALGWFGLGLAESAGGVGYGLAEEALLFREIGRHLAPGPLLPTVLAARVAAGPRRDAILDGS
ncbi:MAG TPA: acyl-CoA dehydrogenase family protein, partial [Acidimicrobiales bacterium]|nr:acyl-CoA dehydrogenase family protein [Acidimicrobiales bacterium]